MDYTDKLAKVYKYSLQEAFRLSSPTVSSDHLILGILRLNEGVAIDIFNRFGIDKLQLKKNLEMTLRRTMPTNKYDLLPTRKYVQIRQRAMLEARKYHAPLVGTEHLLLAYLRTLEEQKQQSIPYKMMKEHDITYQNVQHMIRQDQPKMGVAFPEEQEGIDHDGDNPAANRQDYRQGNATADRSEKKEHSSTPALDAFGTDITQLAAEKKLDPVVGREAEIDRIVQILCRRKKNNPVLIGDPGVGKSAIVEGIAQRIVERRVSRILYDKRIVSIDLAGMVAGTKYRGQFEERIKTMLAELRKHPEIILFIDEIHTIVGAGGPTGTLDAANMLKPSLANGNLQCIGATTLDEYRNSIEK
ncbi:MAG: ATP-dependent Clp protease ATP-binding subunit, partial [Paludibacteraceae bacterium]|nr:ATP-dependent Clp protease ATP-binding subunit [Paludibacteraceae bacterium]